jgi:hypothetical protein
VTKHEQIANIIAFLTILFGENTEVWSEVLKLHPDYLIEKYVRYIISLRIEYPWGMHPTLRNNRFHDYVDEWELVLNEQE